MKNMIAMLMLSAFTFGAVAQTTPKKDTTKKDTVKKDTTKKRM